jgi:hypothetical protein
VAQSGGSGIELVPASATLSGPKTKVVGKSLAEIMAAIVKVN